MRIRVARSGLFRAAVLGGVLASLALVGRAQVQWVQDASTATIPGQPVSGQVKGSAFVAKFGRLQKSGGITLGDSFDHYTITLQDAESGFESNFSIELVLTVPTGTLPDGKTFRRIPSRSLADQPGPGRKDRGVLALAEFYSLTMRYRTSPPGAMAWISSGAERGFAGRLELGKRKGDQLDARVYVCFDDPDKSCAAGTAVLSIW